MEITALKKCKKAKGRYNIYLDNRFGFSLSDEILLDSNLYEGLNLSDDDILELKKRDSKKKSLDSAFRYLSYRMRSEKEMRDKLKEKEYGSDIIEETIKRLYELKYIDDKEFTKSWVAQRVSGRGRFVLRRELLKKGIDNEIIEFELKNIDDKQEIKNAKDLVEKKKKFSGIKDRNELYKKVGDFLTRRGYSYDVVKIVIDDKMKK